MNATFNQTVSIVSEPTAKLTVDYVEEGDFFRVMMKVDTVSGLTLFLTEAQLAELVERGIQALTDKSSLMNDTTWTLPYGPEHFRTDDVLDESNGQPITIDDIVGTISE